jgi:uncharacterized protein YaaQ
MKLIVATVQDQDADNLIENLTKQNYRVTRVGTTGGFLQQGNTTLLMGVEDHQVNLVVGILKKLSQRRTQYMPRATGAVSSGAALYNNYIEVEVGGATVFVLDIDHFEQV